MTMGLVYDVLIIGGCYKVRATKCFRHKKDALRRLDSMYLMPTRGFEQSSTALGTNRLIKPVVLYYTTWFHLLPILIRSK